MAKTLTKRLMELLEDGQPHTVSEMAKATGNTEDRVLSTLRTIQRHRSLASDSADGRDEWSWTDLDAVDRSTERDPGEAKPPTPALPRLGTKRRRLLEAIAAAGRPVRVADLEVEGIGRSMIPISINKLWQGGLLHRRGESGSHGGPGYEYWPAVDVPLDQTVDCTPQPVPAPEPATPALKPTSSADVPSAEDDGTTDDPQATIERLTRERDAAREVVARCAAAAGHDLDDGTGYDGLVDHIAYVVETRRHAGRQLASATAKLNARTSEVADLAERLRERAESEHGTDGDAYNRGRREGHADVAARLRGVLGDDAEDLTLDGLIGRLQSMADMSDRDATHLEARDREVRQLIELLRRITLAAGVAADSSQAKEAEAVIQRIQVMRNAESAWHRTCEAIEQDGPGRRIDIDDPDDLVALWSALDRLTERLPADVALTPARDLVMVLSQYASGRAA
jgi:hypothetical protein